MKPWIYRTDVETIQRTIGSPWSLDLKILDFFQNSHEKGFYIEAGATNGIWQSNTCLLEKVLGWRGLLVEPDPSMHKNSLAARGTTNYFYNAALVDREYGKPAVMGTFAPQGDLYRLSPAEAIHHSELALQAMIGYKNPDFNMKPGHSMLPVPAATLADILDELEILEHINLLSLDVEGSEIPALDGLDLKINRPSYILIETTTNEKKRSRLKKYLTSYNYEFMEQLTPNDAFYRDKKNEVISR